MRTRSPATLAALAAALIFGFVGNPARANVFEDFWGLATDPLKLGHLSDRLQQTVMEALTQLQPLLSQANVIAEQRLNQIQAIVAFAIQGGEAVEEKAFSDMLSLESKIMADVDQVIFRARCAAITTLNGTLQDAIIQALENIAKTQPTLEIAGFPVVKLHLKQVELTAPDKAYFTAKDEKIKILEQQIGDNTNAYEILSTYSNLETLAESTRCFYLDKPNEITFMREKAHLELKQIPWISVVALTPD